MSSPAAKPPRILSGVQPSGSLHLGNYFGAIKQHIELQAQGECFFFIANYHALTSLRDAAALRQNSRDVALTYLSLGLDPARTVFYLQSDVPEVTELAWLLATVTSMGLLERAHSYKEKIAKGLPAGVGLFTYPVLMAADILGPQADLVPVGQDQDQHVEMARDMAEAFNNAFGKPVFKLPKTRLSPTPRVPGTTFEKGAVLQVNASLRLRAGAAGFDAEAYAQVYERAVRDGMAAQPSLDTTEAIAPLLAALDALPPAALGQPPGTIWQLEERTLRTVAERPSSKVNVSRDGELTMLEFYVPLERVVFVTKGGQRQAAKMSKSYGNTIPLFAEGKPLKKTVMGIETRLVELADPLDPKEDLVMALYRLLASGEEVADLEAKYRAGGFGFGRAKQALLDKLDAHFAPFRERRRQLEADPAFVADVLATGARKARAVIRQTLEVARAACGLG